MKYYYGLPDEEYYSCSDVGSVIDMYEGSFDEPYVVIEMKAGPKSGERWCREYGEFINIYAVYCEYCDKYKPRNGKNGICKHNYWGLYKTGRKFLVDPKTGHYKKIRSRSKYGN